MIEYRKAGGKIIAGMANSQDIFRAVDKESAEKSTARSMWSKDNEEKREVLLRDVMSQIETGGITKDILERVTKLLDPSDGSYSQNYGGRLSWETIQRS